MLRCDECGRELQGEVEAHGWKAFIVVADHEPEIAVFCPVCSDREFGAAAHECEHG